MEGRSREERRAHSKRVSPSAELLSLQRGSSWLRELEGKKESTWSGPGPSPRWRRDSLLEASGEKEIKDDVEDVDALRAARLSVELAVGAAPVNGSTRKTSGSRSSIALGLLRLRAMKKEERSEGD